TNERHYQNGSKKSIPRSLQTDQIVQPLRDDTVHCSGRVVWVFHLVPTVPPGVSLVRMMFMPGLFHWLPPASAVLPDSSHSSTSIVTDDKSSRKPVPSLEANSLLRGFGQGETRTIAVQNVSMRLFPGEMALLMGPSGSGKSTLLAMISGLL